MMEGYLIELGGVMNGFFRRNIYTKIDDDFDEEIIRFITDLNNTDIYYTVYGYSNKDIDNCLLYGHMYLDLDLELAGCEDFKKVVRDTLCIAQVLQDEFGIPEELIKVYFSGSKGFHIVIDSKILGIEPHRNLNEHYKLLAAYAKKNTPNKTVDTRIYDRRRLFRFPNSINAKTKLYKVPITLSMLRKISFEKLLEYASEPKEIEFAEPRYIESAKLMYERIMLIEKIKKQMRKNKSKKTKIIFPHDRKELLPCAINILETGTGKGGRNNTSIALASSMYQSGMKQNEVTNTLLLWNEKNDPPLPESEVCTTAKSAYSLAMSGKGYGCTFFKDQGFCVGEACNLFNK